MSHLIAFVVGFTLAIIILSIAYHSRWKPQWECVQHHAAHWEVKDDGSTTFKWNDTP